MGRSEETTLRVSGRGVILDRDKNKCEDPEAGAGGTEECGSR